MKTGKNLFSTTLIDGTKQRKYKPIWTKLIVVFFALNLLRSIIFDDLNNKWENPYYLLMQGGIALALILSVIYYFKGRKIANMGKLEVFEKGIVLHLNNPLFFDFHNLHTLEIERGSTHHYRHDVHNELITVNNFIRFQHEGIQHAYEFIIPTKEKNDEFEQMIDQLSNNRIKLHYTSI